MVQYVYEPRMGLSNARNAGLACANGDIILFTDDDVIVAQDWVEQMVLSIVDGRCDVVTGQITAPPHLMRPWMGTMHKIAVALTDGIPHKNGEVEVYGANMGFRSSVLKKVPAFDPELGAGALGVAEETLFTWQLRKAGFTIGYAPKAQVLHRFDPMRLRRENLLKTALKFGRSIAYLRYHWEHRDIWNPHVTWLSYWARLHLRRIVHKPPPLDAEGCPAWEMSYVEQMEMCKQFRLECQRPRNYVREGFVKNAQIDRLGLV